MTRERKPEFLLTVREGGPRPRRCESRALLLVGSILALTVHVPSTGAMEGQPDWVDAISPAGSVTVMATAVSRSEANELLEGFGLTAGAVSDPEVQVHARDAFHGVQEAMTDWALKRLEINGKFALRQATGVFGQSMTVTSVISPQGILVTDDRGGSRVVAYREFPVATCYRGSHGRCDGTLFDAARDGHGLIVEFIRDEQGFPTGVRFGETLLLRYGFTPPLPEPPSLARADGRWREPSSWDLIDLRTSEIVVDSVEAARSASVRPVLRVFFPGIGELLRFEGGEAFAVAQGYRQAPYALLPLEPTSNVWRSVYANGDMSRMYKFRVDYTDDLVRAEIKGPEYGQSIVVEAPRGLESGIPASIVHPGKDLLTAAMRSGTRLRTMDPLDSWLESTFEKESLPIMLTPLHHRGIEEIEAGLVREASRAEHDFRFGPAEGCEETDRGIVCLGVESEVIGKEAPTLGDPAHAGR